MTERIGFIGLGNMGRGLASNLCRKGFSVTVFDVRIEPVEHLRALGARRGIAFVDAPLGRLSVHAERGESLFMVGASETDFARLKPLLDAMGTTIHHCGGVGAGIRTKLVNNYLAIVSCAFNAEAVALSQKFGLSLGKTLDVIHGTTATNGQLKMAWAAKVFTGDTEPGFAIDLAHKDLTLIVNAANAVNVPMPIGAVARESFSNARTQGNGAKDFSAMGDIHCDLAHVPRPRLL